jgi:hypothetical protein
VPRLRELSVALRIALSALVLVTLGGLAASVAQVAYHHHGRDEDPRMSLDDLRGAYSGIRTRAPLVAALRRGHPKELPEGERTLLLEWLASARISEDYDSLELGEAAPAEVLAEHCTLCHARTASEGGGIGRTLPLEYWDDVQKLAISRQVAPTSIEILTASTHTHALTLALVTLAAGALWLATRWPRALRHGVAMLASLALLADLACWWLARWSDAWVPPLAIAGLLYCALLALALCGVLLDLWLPARRGGE